ncbi:hypothetical protein EYF80_035130 [Liparis tanakae]|uniref:Uncharacterized protein n=1 Tax=Liparis tanakae TaxID=230148 RepID=A0A4Z2GMV3_9TELE|nr:hypothetical protein EYF80_035130 [Liparis tanakae]
MTTTRLTGGPSCLASRRLHFPDSCCSGSGEERLCFAAAASAQRVRLAAVCLALITRVLVLDSDAAASSGIDFPGFCSSASGSLQRSVDPMLRGRRAPSPRGAMKRTGCRCQRTGCRCQRTGSAAADV